MRLNQLGKATLGLNAFLALFIIAAAIHFDKPANLIFLAAPLVLSYPRKIYFKERV